MKSMLVLATGAALAISTPIFAEGDAATGEKEFKKCKACHTIKNGDETIVKGGRTGPNLYGVIGRAAGSEDFKYSSSMIAAGEGGLIWTQENFAAFITDPKAYLIEITGDTGAKSKMTIKAKKAQDDLAAYLASFSPAPAEGDSSTETTTESSDS
jgi:cytochrome c